MLCFHFGSCDCTKARIAEVWEGNAKLIKPKIETAQMTAAKNVIGCSSTTSTAVLRADMRMCPRKKTQDVRKFN